MLLCLENMTETDKLSHYERGLKPKFRIAVRQARCMDVPSAMAEVENLADAHQTNVIVPHLAPAHSTMPHMGVEPMQISVLRNNRYGRKKPPRMQSGPRQGRSAVGRELLHGQPGKPVGRCSPAGWYAPELPAVEELRWDGNFFPAVIQSK